MLLQNILYSDNQVQRANIFYSFRFVLVTINHPEYLLCDSTNNIDLEYVPTVF